MTSQFDARPPAEQASGFLQGAFQLVCICIAGHWAKIILTSFVNTLSKSVFVLLVVLNRVQTCGLIKSEAYQLLRCTVTSVMLKEEIV